MKITKTRLRQIIKEELGNLNEEEWDPRDADSDETYDFQVFVTDSRGELGETLFYLVNVPKSATEFSGYKDERQPKSSLLKRYGFDRYEHAVRPLEGEPGSDAEVHDFAAGDHPTGASYDDILTALDGMEYLWRMYQNADYPSKNADRQYENQKQKLIMTINHRYTGRGKGE